MNMRLRETEGDWERELYPLTKRVVVIRILRKSFINTLLRLTLMKLDAELLKVIAEKTTSKLWEVALTEKLQEGEN